MPRVIEVKAANKIERPSVQYGSDLGPKEGISITATLKEEDRA